MCLQCFFFVNARNFDLLKTDQPTHQSQVLPTVICFFDGITKNGQRQIGFIGLDPVPGGNEDEWPTTALEAVLGNTGVINYVAKVRRWHTPAHVHKHTLTHTH